MSNRICHKVAYASAKLKKEHVVMELACIDRVYLKLTCHN